MKKRHIKNAAMLTDIPMEEDCVYVVGAGFSYGLGFPLVHDLLVRLWPRLKASFQSELRKVIGFHYPGFDPQYNSSFPTIEELLSLMMVNEQLFSASRRIEGTFTRERLLEIRQTLLLEIASWFHEIHKSVVKTPPSWLSTITKKMKTGNATIISFNWDLVLDKILFGKNLSSESYGFSAASTSKLRLIKPHGSLNWFDDPQGVHLKGEKRIVLSSHEGQSFYAFKPYRAPVSTKNRKYMPLIVPPIYGKTFEQPIYEELWRISVESLSRAKRIVFLGYSLPEADLHAKFIFRCAFHNQTDGEIIGNGIKTTPSGKSKVTVVNPDASATRRIESIVGNRVDWQPMAVEKWASS